MNRSRLQTIFYSVAALVALVGLAEATYLTVMFLSGETAICGGSSDCAMVLGSKYAILPFVKIPLSGLGALAYFSAFTFATFALFGYALARKFFSWTVLTMFCMTLWLLYVQAFLLHAFCKYCLFSAALIFLLTGLVVATPPTEETSNV
ncbi:MAG: hypothetical protein DME57_08475 [Verrucomicrobia bacterium]|nr:MAG: hypothetical protein DME57_08475 [Verrucomicrobiota bacterium]